MRRRALLSVTDKTGIAAFARGLVERDFELLSTGGTARALREARLEVTDVADVTGFPEMMDGRLKTLHPAVHGGLLALREEPSHREAMERHGIGAIDVVAVNLYAFRETVAKPGVTDADAVEHIDIGGPSMIRSAAKNHRWVWVVTDPGDYDAVLAGLDAEREAEEGNGGAARRTGGAAGGASAAGGAAGAPPLPRAGAVAAGGAGAHAAPSEALALRRRLATKAFLTTAGYDAAIGNWFSERTSEELPVILVREGGAGTPLRYGENPAQRAAFYRLPGARGATIAGARQLHGKELSYNNIMDADAALELVREFDRPAVAVIKHTNPCGCGVGDDLAVAFARAWSGDPQSAFGGIVAVNRPVDIPLAEVIAQPDTFLEVIVAPSFAEGALEVLTTRVKWGRNVRLLACGELGVGPAGPRPTVLRQVSGGYLLQDADVGFDGEERRTVTERAPTAAERDDLEFAWRVAKHVKSNAIVLARGGAVVGVGAGQMSRVDSVFIARHKAGERTKGAVMASDAFFPFRDSIDTAAQAGITAVIQPGGSIRDDESIAAANLHDMAMVFTGARHFRH